MDKAVKTKPGQYLILSLIVSLAFLVRFYNFNERITFGPEQAISLIVSGDYIREKVTLLGDPNIQRFTKDGLMLFHSPNFNYLMVPLMIILNYQVPEITAYFALLNILTGILIFYIGKKFFNYTAGLFASILFLLDSIMIYHSMFIWIQNYIPLLSAMIVYLLLKIKTNLNGNPALSIFIIGVLASFCLGAQYFFVFTLGLIYAAILYLSKNKLSHTLIFAVGLIAGYLPTIVFNLRNNFYDIYVLWQYTIDTINNPGQNRISYYHFLQFWPPAALFAGWILSKLYNYSKIPAISIISLLLLLNLSSSRVDFFKPAGMPPGLNFPKLNHAAGIIAADNPAGFNITTTYDFDSRAHPLRYLLKFNHNLNPDGVESYPNSKNLYVFTKTGYPITNTNLWEIASFKAKHIQQLGTVDNYTILKLTKK